MTNEERDALIQAALDAGDFNDWDSMADAIAAIEPIIRKDEARECAWIVRNRQEAVELKSGVRRLIKRSEGDLHGLAFADAIEARHP